MSLLKIEIGGSKREFETTYDIDESWINQQIIRRKEDRIKICIRVYIKNESLDMVLKTPACGVNRGSSREPNPQEKDIFDLWKKRGLKEVNFTGGNLIAFLKQLRKIIG